MTHTHRPRRAVCVLLSCLLGTGTAVCGERSVQVGVNDFTGNPIKMRVGLKHPVTVDYRGRDARTKPSADALTKAKAHLAGLDPAKFGEQTKTDPRGGAMQAVVDSFYVLLDGGGGGGPEAGKALDAARSYLAATNGEELAKAASDRADAVARALYMLADGGAKPDELRRLAEPLYVAILSGGPQVWKRRAGDLFFWNMGPIELLYHASYMTADEKDRIRKQIYWALPTDAGFNNNGRWGWIMDWPVALAFEDPEIMGGVVRAFKHWLGFNLYPSGVVQDWVSYDYCASGKDSILDVLSKYLEGLAPADFRVPSYPTADSTQRFGFEDTRDPRKLPGTIWKDITQFRDRWTNHNPPDNRSPGINDTSPALNTPPTLRVQNTNVSSVNLNSSAILRGGPAADGALWGETAAASDPSLILQTFWAYLHADPSDAIHNHYDTNQLLLWWGGDYLAETSGCDCSHLCGIYNRKNGLYAMQTYSKNTVTVDQKCQYITHGQVIDFGVTPGFRVATTDAGYVYDGVFHQRTIAMTPDYLVDLNLLPARDPNDSTPHTFDYMMAGAGQFDRITGWDDYEPDNLWDSHFESEEAYLRWPNLLHIYPYITWGYPRQPAKDWDVSWGENGRNLRMIVTLQPGEKQKACLGRAQLANRGLKTSLPLVHDRLLNGVPKVLVRQEGTSANFLMIYEPYHLASAIRGWKRLDERACQVDLVNGAVDLVLLRRKGARHLWLRYAPNEWCYEPPRIQERLDRLHKVGAFGIQKLTIGDLLFLEADRELVSLLLDCRTREALLYVETANPTSLSLALPQEPIGLPASVKSRYADGKLALQLPAGVSRVQIRFQHNLFLGTKPGTLLPSVLPQFPLDEVREATEDWKLNTSKLIAKVAYKRPYVYADGAYNGMPGVAPWTVAITGDGSLAVAGSHEGFIDAFGPDGQRVWRTFVKGRCLLDYNYSRPEQYSSGHGHLGNPLGISGDGKLIVAGTDAGMLYGIARDGRVLWQREVKFRVQSVAVAPDGSKVAAGAGNKVLLLDGAGQTLFENEIKAGTIDVLLSRDGSSVFYSADDATITCLDAIGKQVWQHRPERMDTALLGGMRSFYRSRQVFHDIALDATGDTLVGCHADYGIYCFDARTGKLRWRWVAESTLHAIAISDDGKNIACSTDGEVFYLDSSGKLLWKFVCPSVGYGMRMSRDGKYVGVAVVTGEWYLLSRDKRIVTRTPLLTPEPFAFAMTPDARRAVIGSIGYDVLIYENKVE